MQPSSAARSAFVGRLNSLKAFGVGIQDPFAIRRRVLVAGVLIKSLVLAAGNLAEQFERDTFRCFFRYVLSSISGWNLGMVGHAGRGCTTPA